MLRGRAPGGPKDKIKRPSASDTGGITNSAGTTVKKSNNTNTKRKVVGGVVTRRKQMDRNTQSGNRGKRVQRTTGGAQGGKNRFGSESVSLYKRAPSGGPSVLGGRGRGMGQPAQPRNAIGRQQGGGNIRQGPAAPQAPQQNAQDAYRQRIQLMQQQMAMQQRQAQRGFIGGQLGGLPGGVNPGQGGGAGMYGGGMQPVAPQPVVQPAPQIAPQQQMLSNRPLWWR